MAGDLTERRKRVLEQAKQAQKQDKLYPREIYDGNNAVGKFPYGGYSEDVQLQNWKNTRQGRQYWLQHDLRMGDISELHRENRVQKLAAQQEYQERMRQKRNKNVDRLLRKK